MCKAIMPCIPKGPKPPLMTTSPELNSKTPGFNVSTVIKTGLLAGTLDICLAFLYSYINSKTPPLKILQYISKVAFGKTTFTDPAVLSITGLLVHFAIAMAWTVLFFILYRLLKPLRQYRIITAVVYGIFVWTMMNVVILPLWNDRPFEFKVDSAVINCLILVVAIGIPLSFSAYRHYLKK